MQKFDDKWRKRQDVLGIRTWMIVRYADDSMGGGPLKQAGVGQRVTCSTQRSGSRSRRGHHGRR